MKNIIPISVLVLLIFSNSCGKSDIQLTNDGTNNYSKIVAADKSMIADSSMLAYYNSTIHNVVFKEFPSQYEGTLVSYIPVFSCFKLIYPKTEESFIELYPGFNFIYQSDLGLPNNQPFVSVIDEVPKDGLFALWRKVQITFNHGFTPRQLYSDDEIIDASTGTNPEITLTMTNKVFYFSAIDKQ